ncbi:MAG: contact-dependent growth inhibition system immunity protein [Bacteroidota bacterium]
MAKTLNQIEGRVPQPMPPEVQGLIANVERLMDMPIDQFSVGDLRLMIGQNWGTEHLMPRALGVLESNPFVCGTFFPGDLLNATLRLPAAYWTKHPVHHKRALGIARQGLDALEVRCDQARTRAFKRYDARLDEVECLDSEERDVKQWCLDFLARYDEDGRATD